MQPINNHNVHYTNLPKGWRSAPLKYLVASEQYSFVDGPFGSDLKHEEYQETGVPLIQLNNIGIGKHIIQNMKYISPEKAEELRRHKIQSGDIVIAKMAEPVARAALVSDTFDEYIIVADCVKLKPNVELIEPQFLVYALNSPIVRHSAEMVASGTTRIRVNLADIKNLIVVIPPLIEQIEIVQYLNTKLAEVDELEDKLVFLASLLTEKKQALVLHSLLRGLNPSYLKLDSKVGWIGEIPEHWNLEFARWLFREIDQRSITGEEELMSVSHITGVTPRSEKDVNMFQAESWEGYKICQPGDLVINTLWAWMGAMGVAFQEGIVSPAYHVYRPQGDYDPRYIDYLVRLPNFAKEVTRYSKGVWSSRLRLYPVEFFKIALPVPPIEEQHEIVAFLDAEIVKLDELSKTIEETVQLLQERRSALIAATVTGKIRVTE